MKRITAMLLAALMLLSAAAFAEDYAIATDTAFRPFEYTDETGTLVGIDVEILAAVAEDQALPTRSSRWAGTLPSPHARPARRTE